MPSISSAPQEDTTFQIAFLIVSVILGLLLTITYICVVCHPLGPTQRVIKAFWTSVKSFFDTCSNGIHRRNSSSASLSPNFEGQVQDQSSWYQLQDHIGGIQAQSSDPVPSQGQAQGQEASWYQLQEHVGGNHAQSSDLVSDQGQHQNSDFVPLPEVEELQNLATARGYEEGIYFVLSELALRFSGELSPLMRAWMEGFLDGGGEQEGEGFDDHQGGEQGDDIYTESDIDNNSAICMDYESQAELEDGGDDYDDEEEDCQVPAFFLHRSTLDDSYDDVFLEDDEEEEDEEEDEEEEEDEVKEECEDEGIDTTFDDGQGKKEGENKNQLGEMKETEAGDLS